ncbi:type III secretion system export apparatus subunit SctT [Parasulfitobacter algicola]|uniref:Type III secretion system export apparatus subunit SctT n=1 Tax=Parasulfitobacter algicola TaxID=2614809 RepID=A0ABX2IX88_9RHOB|nr:type III secretion system export apparatus subunit SctT [Sulfitobacter algicola]NSX56756.1 type III secretion system export apparatus subunit SctT [Sulfitobacter algicola]
MMDQQAFQIFYAELYQFLFHWALAAARILGIMVVFPVFTRVQIGQLIKGGIALAIALPVIDPLGAQISYLNLSGVWQALFVGKEIVVGALFGFLLGIPIWAIQAAGEIIDTQRDVAAEGLDDPSTKSQSSVVASFLGFLTIILFIASGGFQMLIQIHYSSYTFWPLDTYTPRFGDDAIAIAILVLDDILHVGLLTAGPVIVLFMISDISIIGLSKLAPQIASYTLAPFLKNVLFCIFIVAYIQLLPGYILDTFPNVAQMSEKLRVFAPQ